MRICRFNGTSLGVVDRDQVIDVTEALSCLPRQPVWPAPTCDVLIENLPAVRREIERIVAGGGAARHPISTVRLENPVPNPSKIIGAPVNYYAHQDEAQADHAINLGREIKTIDHYGLFLKANSSLIGPSDAIELRMPERRHDHEGELAVIIGKRASSVSRDEALDCVAGYSVCLDMTVRGVEERSLRKSLDTYSVLGPWLVTADEIDDPDNLALGLEVNGTTRQNANTNLLIFDVRRLIEYASSFYTLLPGDIIMTGTPAGVGEVKPGDAIRVWVERIGEFTIDIVARTAPSERAAATS